MAIALLTAMALTLSISDLSPNSVALGSLLISPKLLLVSLQTKWFWQKIRLPQTTGDNRTCKSLEER